MIQFDPLTLADSPYFMWGDFRQELLVPDTRKQYKDRALQDPGCVASLWIVRLEAIWTFTDCPDPLPLVPGETLVYSISFRVVRGIHFEVRSWVIVDASIDERE